MSHQSIDSSTSDAINSVYRMIVEGDIVGASMMAQEVLSDVLGQWQKKDITNSGSERTALADSLLLSSTAYAETLLKQQQPKAAYSAAMTALAYTARVDEGDPSARLVALLTAWASVEQTLSGTAPADASQQEQMAIVASGLASLIYRQYYLAGSDNPDNPVLADAYQTLSVLKSVVKIDPNPVNPLLLLGQVMNASQAAGLLE